MDSPSTASEPTPSTDQTRWFAEEVHPHDGQLRAYLRVAFPSVRDVDDLVQESYLRVWRRQAVRPIESVKAFLFTVARHLALDFIRRENISPIDPVTDLARVSVIESKAAGDEAAFIRQEFDLLVEAVDTLPRRCREVAILRILHGLSSSEAARRLGLSAETIHVQTRRGLLRIQEYLKQRGVIRGKFP